MLRQEVGRCFKNDLTARYTHNIGCRDNVAAFWRWRTGHAARHPICDNISKKTRLLPMVRRQQRSQHASGDDILGPMYRPDDMAGAEERLRLFLIGRFGGPQTYIEQRGHPRLRMRHAPYHIDGAARDRWVQLMGRALDEAALPPDVDALLRPFFDGVATFMRNA